MAISTSIGLSEAIDQYDRKIDADQAIASELLAMAGE